MVLALYSAFACAAILYAVIAMASASPLVSPDTKKLAAISNIDRPFEAHLQRYRRQYNTYSTGRSRGSSWGNSNGYSTNNFAPSNPFAALFQASASQQSYNTYSG